MEKFLPILGWKNPSTNADDLAERPYHYEARAGTYQGKLSAYTLGGYV